MPWWERARWLVLPSALTIICSAIAVDRSWAQAHDLPMAAASDAAARASLAVGRDWLGAPLAPPLVSVERGPLWQGPGAMAVEQRIAQRVVRGWWPPQIADADGAAMLDGFAWYLQTRIVEQIFDRRYLRLAHSVESRAYLGDHIVWSFPPLRLPREAVAGRDRYAAVFVAIERWIGGPALQGAMAAVARLPERELTADAMIRTISDAAGQDLSWAFAPVRAQQDLNYAVTGLSSAAGTGCAAPCVDTTVTVTRDGEGMFPGRSAPRAGAFDSGDAVRLTVTFSDRTAATARWDGRDRSRTFAFRSAVPAVAAELDPGRLVTLDRDPLDNAIVAPAPTNVPVHKWAARWLVWLQHTMLSYGFLA